MKILYTIIISILFSTYVAQAQSHSHHHARNEIGVSAGPFYAIDDKSWGSGVHLHYFRSLGNHSRWAVGGFLEQAWSDENHFSVGVGVKFEVIERLHLGVSPGVSFGKHSHGDLHDHHDESTKARFAMHMELVYDLFEWKKFHVGPVVDYSWSKDDSHVALGVHAAYCF